MKIKKLFKKRKKQVRIYIDNLRNRYKKINPKGELGIPITEMIFEIELMYKELFPIKDFDDCEQTMDLIFSNIHGTEQFIGRVQLNELVLILILWCYISDFLNREVIKNSHMEKGLRLLEYTIDSWRMNDDYVYI